MRLRVDKALSDETLSGCLGKSCTLVLLGLGRLDFVRPSTLLPTFVLHLQPLDVLVLH